MKKKLKENSQVVKCSKSKQDVYDKCSVTSIVTTGFLLCYKKLAGNVFLILIFFKKRREVNEGKFLREQLLYLCLMQHRGWKIWRVWDCINWFWVSLIQFYWFFRILVGFLYHWRNSVARLYHELSWSWHMSFHSEDIKWLGMTDIFQKRICWRQEILCQKFSSGLWFICSGWVAQWDHSCIWESGTIFPWVLPVLK